MPTLRAMPTAFIYAPKPWRGLINLTAVLPSTRPGVVRKFYRYIPAHFAAFRSKVSAAYSANRASTVVNAYQPAGRYFAVTSAPSIFTIGCSIAPFQPHMANMRQAVHFDLRAHSTAAAGSSYRGGARRDRPGWLNLARWFTFFTG